MYVVLFLILVVAGISPGYNGLQPFLFYMHTIERCMCVCIYIYIYLEGNRDMSHKLYILFPYTVVTTLLSSPG